MMQYTGGRSSGIVRREPGGSPLATVQGAGVLYVN